MVSKVKLEFKVTAICCFETSSSFCRSDADEYNFEGVHQELSEDGNNSYDSAQWTVPDDRPLHNNYNESLQHNEASYPGPWSWNEPQQQQQHWSTWQDGYPPVEDVEWGGGGGGWYYQEANREYYNYHYSVDGADQYYEAYQEQPQGQWYQYYYDSRDYSGQVHEQHV